MSLAVSLGAGANSNDADAQRARTWLDEVTALNSDNPAEKTTLATAWIAIGKRWPNSNDQEKGTTLLSAVVQAPDAPTIALLSWGTVCEGSADWAGAQAAYRRVIQRDANNVTQRDRAIAENNLASVLVKSGGNLGEAQQLVTEVLVLFPKEPNFLDTQAMVQSARGDFKSSIDSLKQAKQLDPQNLQWRVNLAQDLYDSGPRSLAETEVQQIAAAFPTMTKVPPELQKKYDSLCAKLQLKQGT
jgi:tetratricopeptide (TPR) repeat protein